MTTVTVRAKAGSEPPVIAKSRNAQASLRLTNCASQLEPDGTAVKTSTRSPASSGSPACGAEVNTCPIGSHSLTGRSTTSYPSSSSSTRACSPV